MTDKLYRSIDRSIDLSETIKNEMKAQKQEKFFNEAFPTCNSYPSLVTPSFLSVSVSTSPSSSCLTGLGRSVAGEVDDRFILFPCTAKGEIPLKKFTQPNGGHAKVGHSKRNREKSDIKLRFIAFYLSTSRSLDDAVRSVVLRCSLSLLVSSRALPLVWLGDSLRRLRFVDLSGESPGLRVRRLHERKNWLPKI